MRLLLKNFQELSASTHDLNDEVVGLQGALTTVGNERDSSSAQNCVGVTFETKEHQNKYLDSVRQCCIELLSMNVGIKNVEPGIRCVLKHIVCMRIGELPQSSSLVRMLSEMKGLACQQLAEELNKQEILPFTVMGHLNMDNTTTLFRFLQEILHTPLDWLRCSLGQQYRCRVTLKQILSDVELVAGPNAGILSKINNTMSDRHIVGKRFNNLTTVRIL